MNGKEVRCKHKNFDVLFITWETLNICAMRAANIPTNATFFDVKRRSNEKIHRETIFEHPSV